ncbi:Sir2 family NAD-dependent protein deacetylase [Micromonospora sp. NPDC003197]
MTEAARPATFPVSTDDNADPSEDRRMAPPWCTRCGGLVRPGVVWFGEALPDGRRRRETKTQRCLTHGNVGQASLDLVRPKGLEPLTF